MKQRLDNEQIEIVYPLENGKMDNRLFRMLHEWKQDLDLNCENVIFVYWNAGLWDCVRIFGDEYQTPIEEYSHYNKKVHYRLKECFRKRFCASQQQRPSTRIVMMRHFLGITQI